LEIGFFDKKNNTKKQNINHKIKEKSYLTTHSRVFSAKECFEKHKNGVGKAFLNGLWICD
jgi:hypothetical protein